RSRHPWRTLFERALGSLPHGAVLSLATGGRNNETHKSPAAAAAGKVVWANEGFERLTGIDAVDFVGQQLGSLLGLLGVEQGDELARSFELGTRCMLWITMGGQGRGQGRGRGQDSIDVFCLHEPIDVQRQLSEEGRYSAFFLVDMTSVFL
ncbi:unnamed protein product, partial [Laminaria digitata]